jgi:hypothetical protein
MAAPLTKPFEETHAALRKILEKYEGKGLAANPDTSGNYVLTGPQTETSWGKDVWFAGVSCFNFTKPAPALFKEVAALTEASYERYRAEKLIR